MTEPLNSFEILKQLAVKDGVYKEGDNELTLQKKLKRKRHQGMQTRYLFEKNESPKNLPSRPDEFGSIAICAIRYAHGVTGGVHTAEFTVDRTADAQVAGFCIDATLKNWNWFSTQEKTVMRRDTEEAIEMSRRYREITGNLDASFLCALEEWEEFDRWLNDTEQQIVYPPKEEVNGLGLLTVYALRYCVGRASYMPSTIIDATKENWHLLNRVDRQQIQNDVQSAIATRHLGHECDRETWVRNLSLKA
jgi:hypothetical protein